MPRGRKPEGERALSGAERQRRHRATERVRRATEEAALRARVADLEAKARDLEAQLTTAPAGDPLAGGPVAAGEIITRLGRRKAVEVARRILALAGAPPR
jgi:hypothetical protein